MAYKQYSERELLDRMSYSGCQGDYGRALTKGHAWTGAETATELWLPTTPADSRWAISSVVITCTTAGVITLFDNTDKDTNWIYKGSMANTSQVVIPFSPPRISAGGNRTLKLTVGGGAGFIQVYGWEMDDSRTYTSTSISTSSSSSISSSSSTCSSSSSSSSSQTTT